jgi:hypothetical protein
MRPTNRKRASYQGTDKADSLVRKQGQEIILVVTGLRIRTSHISLQLALR